MKPLAAQTPAVPADAVLEERVALLYRQAPAGLLSNLAAALVLVLLLWGRAPLAWLLAWLGAVLLQALARGLCILGYRRARPDRREAAAWGWRIAWVYGLGGLLWGIAGFVFFSGDPAVIGFLVMLIAGVTAVSIGSLSAFYPAYLMFSVGAIGPFALRLALEGGAILLGMGAITLVFLLLNLLNGRNILRSLEKAIRLRIENQELAAALRRQKEIAEEASHAKTRFLAAASHDLRQPVYALQLLTDILDHDLAGTPHHPVVGSIKSAGRGLEDLLNSLLDFSRIDAAVIQPELRSFPISAVLGRLGKEFAQQAAAKGLRLEVMPCRLWVRSDPILLERILRNLAANAVRYTSAGGIVIGCRRRGERLLLQVWDSGPGIPSHLQREIFREFYQLGNPERDRAKGLGLGLAIVDGLARLLDHPITLASWPGKGSVFAVSVPLGSVAAAPEVAAPAALDPLKGASILVIDDDALILQAMRQLLAQWGSQVIAAESAEDALRSLAAGGFRPQAVLADYRLRGGATGVEAIRQVRQAAGAPIPAAIVTGDTAPDRLREAKASGFPLLHKPINGGKLRTLLSYLVTQGEP